MKEKLLVHIFPQTWPMGCKETKKETDKWNGHTMDVDACQVSELLKGRENGHAEIKVIYNRKKNEILEILQENWKGYDAFMFVFLTYLHNQIGQKEASIQCFDEAIGVAEILETVKNNRAFVDKDKILIVQADDLQLLPDKLAIKGPTPMPEPKLIPTDADILLIFSSLPQKLTAVGWKDEKQEPDKSGSSQEDIKQSPSMFIKAFVDVQKAPTTAQEDLLTNTTWMNGKVNKMIECLKKKDVRYKYVDLPLPLVTSTLRKLFYVNA